MHTSRKGLYQSCSKNCEISIFGFLPFFFFFVFVNMGPYGGNSFKRHLLWNNTPDLLPKIPVYSWGRVSNTVVKRIVKFEDLDFWQFFFCCSFYDRLTWQSMGNDKMCDILETAGRRVKRNKIWASGLSISCIQGTFDCQVFKFSLRSFSAFPFFWRPFISETPSRRAKRTNIWVSGVGI